MTLGCSPPAVAWALHPRGPRLELRVAALAAAQGRWEAARALAAQASEDEPGFLNDRVLGAEALLHLGRKGEARAELAGVRVTLATRGNVAGFTRYDAAIWELDRKAFDRVVALVKSDPR